MFQFVMGIVYAFSLPHIAINYQDVIGSEYQLVKVNYICADCKQQFEIEITQKENRSALDAERTDSCHKCGQVVGNGKVKCQKCSYEFVAKMRHWHVVCNLHHGQCPQCGAKAMSLCIC